PSRPTAPPTSASSASSRRSNDCLRPAGGGSSPPLAFFVKTEHSRFKTQEIDSMRLSRLWMLLGLLPVAGLLAVTVGGGGARKPTGSRGPSPSLATQGAP